jgi:hypothetical protein
MSDYELHDLSEEHAASIFGVVGRRVGKCSGNIAGQSFKLKKGGDNRGPVGRVNRQ